ncbi:hypothetical protein St703_03340 [Sporolactobacillus terrae]|uniref:Uncharacterized protein n=1 Tax=Sporolactobacillus terrae TaxID=269673 RepID=A0A5K7WRW9_9BACL|nr:hypothetical protein St703_01160 [Sporolactobacillus terrae]BBN97629.1 hypothetical protein St703_03340 [Sporolactobacillus terrae]
MFEKYLFDAKDVFVPRVLLERAKNGADCLRKMCYKSIIDMSFSLLMKVYVMFSFYTGTY